MFTESCLHRRHLFSCARYQRLVCERPQDTILAGTELDFLVNVVGTTPLGRIGGADRPAEGKKRPLCLVKTSPCILISSSSRVISLSFTTSGLIGWSAVAPQPPDRTTLASSPERSERNWSPGHRPTHRVTLPLRNDGAVRRVGGRIESGFPLQNGSRLGDPLACPSRDPDASGPRGSSAHTPTSAASDAAHSG